MKMILCKRDPSRVLRGQNPDILAKSTSINKITFKNILKEGIEFVFKLLGGGGEKFSLIFPYFDPVPWLGKCKLICLYWLRSTVSSMYGYT